MAQSIGIGFECFAHDLGLVLDNLRSEERIRHASTYSFSFCLAPSRSLGVEISLGVLSVSMIGYTKCCSSGGGAFMLELLGDGVRQQSD